ncbi:unnamed protein product [Staurois parvus]|uniref:Uncharacterized protein n=1 Tax=Staurois parvus TaxID=386267 RepID=A0ABN9CRJ3_9NEOB|nr:unnamed protein product [Staurois parvus]
MGGTGGHRWVAPVGTGGWHCWAQVCGTAGWHWWALLGTCGCTVEHRWRIAGHRLVELVGGTAGH